MPTISALKDQARVLEQQGQIDKALNIYQHILKHLEGNPAITKVLPLYVKAGDLLLKMDRADEAVASYQAGAEHYASTGAAPRVTALCEKICRHAPERTDVYTSFVRLLIEHGHVGSARDVLAEYAQIENMDRALETLNDLAGRPNSEVQPMLERLLESFELEEQDDHTAERVSSQLEQVTDDLAGELTGVLEAEETLGEPDPLASNLLDLDSMPRQSSILRAISDEDLDEPAEEDEETPEIDQSPEAAFTADVTPTMESPSVAAEEVDDEALPEEHSFGEEAPAEDAADEDDGMGLLLAESVTSEDADEIAETVDSGEAVEIERSQWTPDFPEPSAKGTVAAEWSPEEDLQPSARYPSDEYDAPDGVEDEEREDADATEVETDTDELDDEIARAVEESEPFAPAGAEPEPPADVEESAEAAAEDTPLPAETEPGPEPLRRPSRPPRVMLPDDTAATSKSPVLFGIGGFVVGLLVGAVLTFVLFGGGSGGTPAAVPEQDQAAVETPVAAETEAEQAPVTTPEPAETETAAVATPEEAQADSVETVITDEAAAETPEEVAPDTAATEVAIEQPTDVAAPVGNPIIVEGLRIESITPATYRGRLGFRVEHLLASDELFIVESYRDTTILGSGRVTIVETPSDTIVGIVRLDGYEVIASCVMPEDNLRSLMSRLAEGERPPN